MIYITGDCHGNFERFNSSIFPEQNEMTKDDYVIICGDFGGVWNKDEESKMETMIFVNTDQTEHTARRFSAWLPPIQCTLSGHQCMLIIQV